MCFRDFVLALILALCLCATGGDRFGPVDAAAETPRATASSKSPPKIVPLHKTDTQWRRQLTSRQFAVTRRKETEPPYHNKYWRNKRPGEYRCACCELELFKSAAKYDSHTGWPTFTQPLDNEHVAYDEDRSELPERIEVKCARCDAHLGHLFSDGPPPFGLRYCMNSAALEFIAAEKPLKKAATSTATNR